MKLRPRPRETGWLKGPNERHKRGTDHHHQRCASSSGPKTVGPVLRVAKHFRPIDHRKLKTTEVDAVFDKKRSRHVSMRKGQAQTGSGDSLALPPLRGLLTENRKQRVGAAPVIFNP
jgi:hypothetical protein